MLHKGKPMTRRAQGAVLCLAGVIEHIGWTKGSHHLQIEEQSWVVRHMIDVFAFLGLIVTALLAALTWAAVKVGRLAVRLLRRGATISKKQQ